MLLATKEPKLDKKAAGKGREGGREGGKGYGGERKGVEERYGNTNNSIKEDNDPCNTHPNGSEEDMFCLFVGQIKT